MKINRFAIYFAVGIFVFVTSCSKKDEPTPIETTPVAPLSATQADAEMNTLSTSMTDDANDFKASEGYIKLQSVTAFGTSNPLPGARLAANDIENVLLSLNGGSSLGLFKKLFIDNPTTAINARVTAAGKSQFDFQSKVGIYTWNDTLQTWDSTASSDNYIVVNFPTDSTKKDVNDGILTIKSYSERAFVNAESQPTSIIANLIVGGVEVARINYAGIFSADAIPTYLSLDAYIKPWNFKIASTDAGSSVSMNYSINKDGQSPITSTALTVTFEGTDKKLPNLVTGYFQYRNIKLKGVINALEVRNHKADSIITEAQANQWIDIDVLRSSDEAKMADLYIQGTGNQQTVVIKFNDGTIKQPETYFQSIIDEMNKLANQNIQPVQSAVKK